MPLRFLRVLLAVALALTVPLQGLAAATAGMCMALGHHDAPQAHAHDASGDDHGHDEAPAGANHCAPCVACCAAAAISPSVPVVVADKRADEVNVAGPPPSAGIQPETLDRPPLAL